MGYRSNESTLYIVAHLNMEELRMMTNEQAAKGYQ